jgi:rsbT co-antagonist protein RsbR
LPKENNKKEIERLRRENEEYKKLIEEMSEGFAYLEEDLIFSFSNPACDSVFGVPEGKLMGEKLQNFLNPESFKEIKKNIGRKEEKKKKSVFEMEVNAKDGEIRYLLTRSNPQFDEKGKFVGSFVFFYNITKRINLEKELIFKEGLLNSLLNTIPDLIYFKDKESRFIEISKSKADQVGLPREKVIGTTDFDYFTEEHARPAYEDEQEIMKTGKPLEGKVEKETHPDGRVTWVSTTKVPRYDEKGKIIGILGISRDITEKKLWEEEREKKLEAQKEELIGLSTPVIDVWEGVLTVPILGSLDSERASRVSEALLTQIVEEKANTAIIDISGISAVDSAVADRLIRTAKAVRLVGAEAILTGVGVEIAQTIADLGIDMEGLKTMSTLKDGLRYVISRKDM